MIKELKTVKIITKKNIILEVSWQTINLYLPPNMDFPKIGYNWRWLENYCSAIFTIGSIGYRHTWNAGAKYIFNTILSRMLAYCGGYTDQLSNFFRTHVKQ